MKRHLQSAATVWDRENRTVQSVAAGSIVYKFLKRLCMDRAWESINGFLLATEDQEIFVVSGRVGMYDNHTWQLILFLPLRCKHYHLH